MELANSNAFYEQLKTLCEDTQSIARSLNRLAEAQQATADAIQNHTEMTLDSHSRQTQDILESLQRLIGPLADHVKELTWTTQP